MDLIDLLDQAMKHQEYSKLPAFVHVQTLLEIESCLDYRFSVLFVEYTTIASSLPGLWIGTSTFSWYTLWLSFLMNTLVATSTVGNNMDSFSAIVLLEGHIMPTFLDN